MKSTGSLACVLGMKWFINNDRSWHKKETWASVPLPRRHGRHAQKQKKETVEDRVCIIVWLTTRVGNGRSVLRSLWSKKVFVTWNHFLFVLPIEIFYTEYKNITNCNKKNLFRCEQREVFRLNTSLKRLTRLLLFFSIIFYIASK